MTKNAKNVVATLVAMLALACGGRDTVASKSAAAYRETQAKGQPVGGGHEHGGHAAESATATTTADPHAGHDMSGGQAPAEHGAASTAHDGHGSAPAVHGSTAHASSQHSAAGHAAMQHGGAQGGAAPSHGAMQHGSASAGAAHAQHGAAAAPKAGPGAMQQPAAQHGAGHEAMTQGTTSHAGHGAASAPGVAAPTTSAETSLVRPAVTLRPDAFDAAVPISVSEAAKAAGGGGHEGQGGASTGHEGHDSGEAAGYTCPMHPEVKSTTPGSCPKCGMALVKAAPEKDGQR